MNQHHLTHVMQIVGDPVGGIRKHVHSIIFGLDTKKFKQSYAFSVKNTDTQFTEDIRVIKRHLENRVLSLEIKKKPAIEDFINIAKLMSFIRKNDVQIVHGHGAKAGVYARVLSVLCGIKSVYTPHGGFVHNMFSPIEDFVYKVIERILFYFTDQFIFESYYTQESYFKKVGHKQRNSIVNYNGVQPIAISTDAKKIIRKNDKQILHFGIFGMLRPQKGQEYALKALAGIINILPSVQVHIFGSGPDYDRLQDLAKMLQVPNVIFYGDVAEQDVYGYMRDMDLIIIPSLFESFGYVAVEAMMLDKFIIASDVGGLKEVLCKYKKKIMVPPANVIALSEAIEQFINLKKINFIPEEEIGFLKEYTVEVMLKNLEAIYHQLHRA